MKWTEDGWLRMADGSHLAKMETEESNLLEVPMANIPDFDDFDGEELGNWYYAPRIMPPVICRCKGTFRLCENPGTGIPYVS